MGMGDRFHFLIYLKASELTFFHLTFSAITGLRALSLKAVKLQTILADQFDPALYNLPNQVII